MKRNFLYLAVITVIALVLVFIGSPTDRSSEKSAVNDLLLPAIADEINQVDHVEIVTAGDTTVATLLRKDDAWQVQQMDGYRADWPKLQKLLAALAQARVVEAKTDKPEYYARLGVGDISDKNAGGVLVRVGVGDQLTGILIGHAAEGLKGQYVRLQDSAGSVLVDRQFEVPKETLQWTDTKIIDINSSEVAEVEIIHPTKERVLVTKVSADDTDFELDGLPEGREVKSSWAVNSLGSVLSLLNMESVRPADSVDWKNAVKLRLLTFSGVEILADLVQQGDDYLVRLHAAHPAASVASQVKAAPVAGQTAEQEAQNTGGEADQKTSDSAEKNAADADKKAAEEVAKRVQDINNKVDGWAYGISKAKYDNMVKKPEDLLKPLKSE
jgi:hypothetical protein